MAKVSAHGSILLTRFSVKHRALLRYMSDGVVLRRSALGNWKVHGKIKEGLAMDEYYKTVDHIIELQQKQPEWLRNIKSLPSYNSLTEWAMDGMCETPDGCMVEPDGRCPHNAPSWLLIVGWY